MGFVETFDFFSAASREQKRDEKRLDAQRKREDYEEFNDRSFLLKAISSNSEELLSCFYPTRVRALYNVLARVGTEGSVVKAVLSPTDIEALSRKNRISYFIEQDDSPLEIMGKKEINLSLLFRSFSELKSPEGRAILSQIENLGKENREVYDTLNVRVMKDKKILKDTEGFIVATTHKSSQMNLYKYEGPEVAVLRFSPSEASANLDNQFDRLFSQAIPVPLKNPDYLKDFFLPSRD